MKVIIAGCGWLGSALGRRLVERGDRVVGIRRDPAGAADLDAAGIEPLILDLTSAGAAARLPADAEAVVACQAADSGTPESYRRAYLGALRPLIEATAAGASRRLVFTGSTSVFGQSDGGWVEETTPVAPRSETARILAQAEERLREAHRRGVATWVVRLSGLYGPGRYGVIDRVRSGRLGSGPGDARWMNFCHREDAVRTVLAALDRGRPGATYHGSDATPMRVREVVRWICERAGIAEPAASNGAPSRRGDRRVSSRRTREELDVELAYPSIREGLAAAPW